MSQTSLFAKSNNPDYIYFDLQTTNVYNNDLNVQPALKFLESRDAPLVPNSGDYHMSVIRFQTDNYNLPVLLAEPDLSSTNAGPFDPAKTIHKVAVLTDDAFIPYASTGITPLDPAYFSGAGVAGDKFGASISILSDEDAENEVLVGAPNESTSANFGRVFHFNNTTKTTLPNAATLIQEGYGVAFGRGQGEERFALTTGKIGTEGYIASYKRNEAGVWSSLVSPYNALVDSFLHISTSKFDFLGDANTDKLQLMVGGPEDDDGGTASGRVGIYSMSAAGVFAAKLSIHSTTANHKFGTAVAMSWFGNIAVGTSLRASNVAGSGYVRIFENTSGLDTSSWAELTTSKLTQPAGFNPNSHFGASVALSDDGDILFVGAPLYSPTGTTDNEGAVVIYFRSTSTTWVVKSVIEGGAGQKLGTSISCSRDGQVLMIGSEGTHDVSIYQVSDVTGVASLYAHVSNPDQHSFGNLVVFQDSGYTLYAGSSAASGAGIQGGIVDRFELINQASHYPIPNGVLNIPSVKQVLWSPDLTSEAAPPKSQLTGRNTAIFPYYQCHSYEYFVSLVNDAIAEASIANYSHLWTTWFSSASDREKQVFLDAAYRSFPTPPLMDWDTDLATFFVNQLYNTKLSGNNAVPDTNWETNQSSNTITGTAEPRPPFNFKLAFNSSLYALFNSFPAKETILTIGGVKERYYVLDFLSTGKDTSINNPILNKVPVGASGAVYNFDVDYRNPFTGHIVIPTPTTGPFTYSYINEFIRQQQELSTIPTWTPINAIVFTSNTLPIVPNQVSAVSTLGVQATPSSTGNDFALIITDIQSSDGFLPNILYVPSGENRYIDMTGNQPIRNIDINVFYRVKTGQLIPLRLPSGGTASIKVLFKKKIQAEKQKIQFETLKVKDTGV